MLPDVVPVSCFCWGAQAFVLVVVVQCDVAANAWLICALGMPLVVVPHSESSRTFLCAYLDVGQPPVDPTAAGALGELCVLRVGDLNDESGPRVLFQGLPALLRAGSTPLDTVSCLPPEARGPAEAWRHSLLRDPKEAELWAVFRSRWCDALLDTLNFCIKPLRQE